MMMSTAVVNWRRMLRRAMKKEKRQLGDLKVLLL